MTSCYRRWDSFKDEWYKEISCVYFGDRLRLIMVVPRYHSSDLTRHELSHLQCRRMYPQYKLSDCMGRHPIHVSQMVSENIHYSHVMQPCLRCTYVQHCVYNDHGALVQHLPHMISSLNVSKAL